MSGGEVPLLVPLPVVSRGGVVAASAVMLVLSGGAVPALLGLGAVQSAVVVLGSSGVCRRRPRCQLGCDGIGLPCELVWWWRCLLVG